MSCQGIEILVVGQYAYMYNNNNYYYDNIIIYDCSICVLVKLCTTPASYIVVMMFE